MECAGVYTVSAHASDSGVSVREELRGVPEHEDHAFEAAQKLRDSDAIRSAVIRKRAVTRQQRTQHHVALTAVAAATVLALTLAAIVTIVHEGAGTSGGAGEDWYALDSSMGSEEVAVSGKPGSTRRLMMMSQPMLVAGIGDGLFALVFLYLTLFITCGIACLVENWKCTCVAIVLFIAILIVTLILVLAPRVPAEEKEARLEADKLRVFDMFFIPQVFIMTLVWVGVVVSFVIFFFTHCISPVHIRSLDD